ncbi:unnamed protein product, partial [Meganyctiphanes norvegica]
MDKPGTSSQYDVMAMERGDNNGYDANNSDSEGGFCDVFLTFLTSLLIFCTFPITLWFCFKTVQEYERAVIFRLGRLKKGKPAGPGLFFLNTYIDTIQKVDLRTISLDIPPQEILTKDSVTVAVDAVMYYRVANPMSAVCNVSNY